MSNRTARKILVLATLVAPAAVSASPDKLAPPASWANAPSHLTAVMMDGHPYLVAPATAPVDMSYAEYGRFLGETQPLVGPDGRPGCGNILSKGDGGCGAARDLALEKRLRAVETNPEASAVETSRDAVAKWRAEQAANAVAGVKTRIAAAKSAVQAKRAK